MHGSTVNQSNQNYHDCDHQQNVNETAHGFGSDQAKQPQDEHNNGNGIEHDSILSINKSTSLAAPVTIHAAAVNILAYG
jgi:hypothetical protein